ncbi:MAG: hypothetical protein M3044_03330 [Thermoproteota archaeon]|nr:hypothetical protein [Thermoproteota archaeon]
MVFFIQALEALPLSILISEASQRAYGQTQSTVTDYSIVRDLSWPSFSLDSKLKPTSNVITLAASTSDNGNNNTTPFLLPSVSSGNNLQPPAPSGLASTTLPSNNIVDNSNSAPQGGHSNKENITNSHHDDHSISQTNIISSNDNQVADQHKIYKDSTTAHIILQLIRQGKQQFTGGEIPFP